MSPHKPPRWTHFPQVSHMSGLGYIRLVLDCFYDDVYIPLELLNQQIPFSQK